MPDPAAEHGQWAAGRGQRAGAAARPHSQVQASGAGPAPPAPPPPVPGPLCPGVPGGAVRTQSLTPWARERGHRSGSHYAWPRAP